MSNENETTARPTIVLVHGAWTDGSSWAEVTEQLQRGGFTVAVVPNGLRGVATDVRYLHDYLATIAGPVVLVGHSYGGIVITGAAAGNANVNALVYVNAYIPQGGDTVLKLTASQPGSKLHPQESINAVPIRDASADVVDVDVYLKPGLFGTLLAGGVQDSVVARLAANQRPLTLSSLSEEFTGTPAWRTIPSWAVVGTDDEIIPSAAQEIMANQAGAQVVKIPAPHLSIISHPDVVTALIVEATN